MRNKIIVLLGLIAATLLTYVMFRVFFVLPDEMNQGAIYRIIYFHVPGAITGFTGFVTAMIAAGLYLATGDLKYDSFSASVTEVSLAFASINLVTGMVWARIIWGVWWAWDMRLTTMLICWLIYAGYLMLRRAIDEPTKRAKLSAVFSFFGCIDIGIVWKSIEWWNTQHPQPVLSIRDGGGMAPGMEAPIYINLVALLCLSACMIMVRMRQEAMSNEIDSLRRMAHTI